MRKKFTHHFLKGAIWVGVISCQDEEVASPPKPTFQADKTSAEVGEEIAFTINRVNADAISLLPCGLSGGGTGVLVKFTDESTATVKFAYPGSGTFQPIVAANNPTGDGESTENVNSEPISITIFSSKSSISAFSFKDITADTDIDEAAKTIMVTVPYGTNVMFTNTLATTYSSSGVAVTSMEVDGNLFVSGDIVDCSEPVEFALNVTNSNLGVDLHSSLYSNPDHCSLKIKRA